METIPQEQEPLLETCKQLMLLGDIADQYTYQTFPDGKPSSTPPTILHGRIDNCWDELDALNAKGHGIFLMINGGDGKGRATENVTTLRALFIDEDLKDGVISKPFHLPPSLIVKSGGGRHIYWRLKAGESLDRFKAAQQRLAAYYSTDPKVCDLPRVLRLCGFKHQKAEPVMVVVTDSNTDAAYTIDELMAGIPEVQAPVESKVIPANQAAASNKVYAVVPMQYRVDAAIEFLNTAEPAVSGAGGHTALMAVAGALINGFLLDYSIALDLIEKYYNPNCLPPFSTRDIEHKLTDASTKGPRHSPENYLTSALERVYRDQVLKTIKAPESVKAGEPAIDVAMPSPDKNKKRLLKWRSAPEFAASTPVEIPWVVENLFALNAITEIDGQVKSAGKSTFICAAIKKVLHGLPFVDFRTVQTNAIYLSEAPETAWRQTLDRADLLDEPGFYFISTKEVMEAQPEDGGRLTFADIVSDAVAHAFEVNAKLMVIDTLSEFADFGDDKENDSGAAKKVTDVLKLAANAGMCVVVLRHDRKGGGRIGQSGRGSSALTGQVDNIIHIEDPEGPLTSNQRYLSVKGRLGEGFDRRILEVNTSTWEYSLEADHSGDVRKATLRGLIFSQLPSDELSATSRKMTENHFCLQVVEASKTGDKFRRTEVAQAVKEMILAGSICTSVLKAKGSPKLVFAAPSASPFPGINNSTDSLDS